MIDIFHVSPLTCVIAVKSVLPFITTTWSPGPRNRVLYSNVVRYTPGGDDTDSLILSLRTSVRTPSSAERPERRSAQPRQEGAEQQRHGELGPRRIVLLCSCATSALPRIRVTTAICGYSCMQVLASKVSSSPKPRPIALFERSSQSRRVQNCLCVSLT